jgi:NAD-dependent deacetylase
LRRAIAYTGFTQNKKPAEDIMQSPVKDAITPETEWPDQVHQLCAQIGRFRHIAVLTGAGMSAESGIPTFRGTQHALWAAFDFEQLATPEAWQQDPARVWAWYEWRRAVVEKAQPHAGHLALAEWAQHTPLRIVTQNVDNLHERAGSQDVIHLHGSLFAPRCAVCAQPHTPCANTESTALPTEAQMEPPRCRYCGEKVRPGVVWFNEEMPTQPYEQALAAVATADLLIVVGTSASVYPSALLPKLAQDRGLPVLVINPQTTDHTQLPHAIHWASTAARALPALLQCLHEDF